MIPHSPITCAQPMDSKPFSGHPPPDSLQGLPGSMDASVDMLVSRSLISHWHTAVLPFPHGERSVLSCLNPLCQMPSSNEALFCHFSLLACESREFDNMIYYKLWRLGICSDTTVNTQHISFILFVHSFSGITESLYNVCLRWIPNLLKLYFLSS